MYYTEQQSEKSTQTEVYSNMWLSWLFVSTYAKLDPRVYKASSS